MNTMPLKKYCSYETSKKWQIIVTVLIGCSLISGLVILIIIGGTIYHEERPKELRYESDRCLVVNKNIRIYWCSSRASRYRCYAPVWTIVREHFEGSNTTMIAMNRFRIIEDAYQKADRYQIGSLFSCWYDKDDAFSVQWDKPDARFGLILLILGGLLVIPIFFTFFATFKLCRDVRKHQQQTLINPYSHTIFRDFSSISRE